jgi:hypothetical protein
MTLIVTNKAQICIGIFIKMGNTLTIRGNYSILITFTNYTIIWWINAGTTLLLAL